MEELFSIGRMESNCARCIYISISEEMVNENEMIQWTVDTRFCEGDDCYLQTEDGICEKSQRWGCDPIEALFKTLMTMIDEFERKVFGRDKFEPN